MSDSILHVNDDNFEQEVLQADAPVLIDFWAEWCAPCKSIATVLEELATEYVGRLKIVKLNVDENRSIAEQYGIRGIPTLIIFKNGNSEATQVGALNKSQLSAFIDQNI